MKQREVALVTVEVENELREIVSVISEVEPEVRDVVLVIEVKEVVLLTSEVKDKVIEVM